MLKITPNQPIPSIELSSSSLFFFPVKNYGLGARLALRFHGKNWQFAVLNIGIMRNFHITAREVLFYNIYIKIKN